MFKRIIKSFFEKFGLTVLKSSTLKEKYFLSKSFNPLKSLFYYNLNPNFFFLQIGANDGISFDPIYKLVTKEKVSGIALEPVNDIFEKLKKSYQSHPQVKLLNLAVHKSEKKMSLYRVNPLKTEYPKWTQGTPSFNKNHHKLGGINEEDIIEEVVDCISFNELLEIHDIKNIDLLQIDTEGYDSEIIKMIDFNVVKPKIISFEHGMRQGIMSNETFQVLQNLLFSNGYNLVILENDAIAYIPK